MKHILSAVAFFATIQASAQQVNPVPDYVFRNQMSVGRGTVTDTAAYFSIGPRYGANKGFMPPIVGDTATFSSGKRNGLLIFSVQKNKFLYWDSVRVQWSDMAGSSGSYITGSGILGYIPQFTGTTTLDTSALYTLGSRLGIGTSTFAYNSTSTANIELNNTAGGILGFKRNDSARGYLWHTGDNMELANTTAGSIFFNTNSATRGSISSAGVWRLHNLAGTGDRVVQASSNGTLSATTSVTGLVDTTTIATRAWRQKGDDSLGAIIATKVNISDTATMLTNYTKGSGTTNYLPKFTASTTLGNSQIFDNGTNVGIGTASPNEKLEVFGGNLRIAKSSGEVAFVLRTGTNEFYGVNNASLYGLYSNDYGSLFVRDKASGFLNIYDKMRIFANGRIGVNTTTDAGYQFDVNGTLRTVNGANFATTSGNVGVGTASPQRKVVSEVIAANDFNYAATSASLGTIGNWVGYLYGFSGNTYQKGATFFESIDGNARGKFHIALNDAATSANVTLSDARLTVTSSGNVGIGTASPLSKLNVQQSGSTFEDGITISLSGATRGTNFLDAATDTYNFTRGGASGTGIALNSSSELLINTTTDAGDYKLQVAGNIYNTGSAVLAATSGNVGVGVAPSAWDATLKALQVGNSLSLLGQGGAAEIGSNEFYDGTNYKYIASSTSSLYALNQGQHRWFIAPSGTAGGNITFTQAMTLNTASELLVNTTTDAGDYKLQVVGNARVGTGKLDISSNTAFSMNVQRSGTSEVAGTFNNSNGILYLGAESSAGAGIFTGSSAYAAVIGSGANYPLQFATNNVTRATINTNGELLINTTTDNGDFKLQVNGNALISGSIKTANGGTSTAQPWHLGSVVATNVQLDTANYVEVEINGVFYRLAIVTPL